MIPIEHNIFFNKIVIFLKYSTFIYLFSYQLKNNKYYY